MIQGHVRSSFAPITSTVDRWFSTKLTIWLLSLLTLLLFFLLTYPHLIYIRKYPQDVFGFLDGINRLIHGQVPNRDFSSPFGALVYSLPALFVKLGANPVLSLAYAQATLLVVNFFIMVHLIRSRITGMPGLLFAVLTLLLLAARMNLGEDMRFVTFAESYNRQGTVFLSDLLIFLIPPKKEDLFTFAADIFVISVLILILFYTKMTYFAVAVAALALLSLTSRANAARIIGVLIIFAIVVSGIEFTYRFLEGYFAALFMTGKSSGFIRESIKSLFYLIEVNLWEIVICCFLPVFILYKNGALNRIDVLAFAFVTVASLVLLFQNLQEAVLVVPFTLLLIACDINERRTKPSSRQTASKGVIYTAMIGMFLWYSYPLVLNIAVSFSKSILDTSPVGGERITQRLSVYRSEMATELLNDIARKDISAFDVFARRSEDTAIYIIPLEDGVRAAQDHCGKNARIVTLDQYNPFPAILELPPAGRFVLFTPSRTIAKNSYPPPDEVLGGATCIMVPKVPIDYAARQLLLTAYGSYITNRFKIAGTTNYWVVYALK